MTKLEAIGILTFIKNQVEAEEGGKPIAEAIDIANEAIASAEIYALKAKIDELLKP